MIDAHIHELTDIYATVHTQYARVRAIADRLLGEARSDICSVIDVIATVEVGALGEIASLRTAISNNLSYTHQELSRLENVVGLGKGSPEGSPKAFYPHPNARMGAPFGRGSVPD